MRVFSHYLPKHRKHTEMESGNVRLLILWMRKLRQSHHIIELDRIWRLDHLPSTLPFTEYFQ